MPDGIRGEIMRAVMLSLALGAGALVSTTAQAADYIYTGGVQTYTVGQTGIYSLSATGGSGGLPAFSGNQGGLGALVRGNVTLTAGTILSILVGGAGGNNATGGIGGGGGGGGGTYALFSDFSALIIAGGGGGATVDGGGQNSTGVGGTGNGGAARTASNIQGGSGYAGGGGGAGLNTDGANNVNRGSGRAAGGGFRPAEGGAGGVAGTFGSPSDNRLAGAGGFGGGGGGSADGGANNGEGGGGGGGGYTGGDGGAIGQGGTAGTSFVGSTVLASQFATSTTRGNGQFSINLVQAINPPAVPEPATWGMVILGMGMIGGTLRRRQKVTTRVSYAA